MEVKCCRACDNPLNHCFLSLGPQPLANSYLSQEKLSQVEASYPLDVYLCKECYLVQLLEYESAENIFSDYAYFSSYSKSWLEHAKKFTQTATRRLSLDKQCLVIEVASNDGYLLQYFKESRVPVLGIEPAANIAEVAIQKGIPTKVAFLTYDLTQSMKEKADLVVANNVIAHNPRLRDFVAGLKALLKPEGVVSLEFPHLLRLLDESQFDTIYHEHFSYFSLHSLKAVLEKHDLEIFDVEELSTHGGSLRVWAQCAGSRRHQVCGSVSRILEEEATAGLLKQSTYDSFGEKVAHVKRELVDFMKEQHKAGKKIVGYGAPAKGNTLLNYCKANADWMSYTVDRNPHKQEHYLPGTHIPICGPDRIREDRPNFVLILPWNLKDEIMKDNAFIHEWGGRFVIPIPHLEII